MRRGKKGQLGTPTNIVRSPAAEKRAAKRRKRQEQRWAAKNGPLTVRKIDDKE